jgi:ribosomal protein S18 acetylase RimI-like enzyme
MQSVNFATPRGNITIRAAQASDVVQYRELRLHALQNAPTAFSSDYETNARQTMDYWESRLSQDENRAMFLAEADHHLIGMTGIGRRESPKTKHSADIYSVYVRPEWRGLHIAEALIEACIEWAKTREVNIVKLGVLSSSTSAIRCYQRCGFTIYGTEPRGIFYERQYYDGYFMARVIT